MRCILAGQRLCRGLTGSCLVRYNTPDVLGFRRLFLPPTSFSTSGAVRSAGLSCIVLAFIETDFLN